jgi:hypothetical protein
MRLLGDLPDKILAQPLTEAAKVRYARDIVGVEHFLRVLRPPWWTTGHSSAAHSSAER